MLARKKTSAHLLLEVNDNLLRWASNVSVAVLVQNLSLLNWCTQKAEKLSEEVSASHSEQPEEDAPLRGL